MRSDFKYWLTIQVRWRDMDSQNHVNSVNYFAYFEMVRMDYFRSVGLQDLKVPGKVGPAVVSQTCNYRKQVVHPAVIEAGVRSKEVGERTFSVEYELYLEGTDTLVADGHTVMAWVDYEAEKAIALPDVLRDSIAAMEARG